ncbi:alpha/beta fold hydrolase, partial [Amaricoccus sp. W119]|uniref:alpha/beta fold hydrolase n=1 Tax=Amaricoccus sp. W119 TaxID=3391833 RepID=UPI0039A5E97F
PLSLLRSMQKGNRWPDFTPPAAGLSRRYRGRFLHRRSHDSRAYANREIADAVAASFAYTFGTSPHSEAAFCADLVRIHEDWPKGLGDVACPVTLIHGEQDGNAPFETALEYCAMYPNWRYIGFPVEGQLVALARWSEVFDIIEATMA